MKKILSLLLVLMMIFGCMAVMSSCFGKDDGGTDNGGGKKDEGSAYEDGDVVASSVEVANAAWTEQQKLIMNISDSSNNREMSAGGRAYVAGKNNYTAESAEITDALLEKVIARNSDAAAYANVKMVYSYSDWAWGKATGSIGTNIASGASNMPDVYYDSVYDMVASSLKGHFLNVLGNQYYNGAGENAAAGYNRDYMDVMTFSTQAEYLIASDMSVDISRSFYILPVNMKILSEKAALLVEDRDGDQKRTVADFYSYIDKQEWTWEFVAILCEAVKVEAQAGGYTIEDGIVGMAIDAKAGLAASGLCYASELKIIDRTVENGEYVYTYEPTGAALRQVATTLEYTIADTDGFVAWKSETYNGITFDSTTEAIAHAFADNHALIGNVILLGAIEDDVYRSMWKNDDDEVVGQGFVCAPMPLYSKGTYDESKSDAENWSYHTVVHNLAKVFGIATTAQAKLDRAVAYLDYGAQHSTKILEDYYKWTILYGAVEGDEHNVAYLTYMKNNMEYNLDKTVDDALGCDVVKVEGTNFYKSRWHKILLEGNSDDTSGYKIGDGIVPIYQGLYKIKENAVKDLQKAFLKNVTSAAK